jgi:RimJ/RimL family protein N-acetyltransferase
VPVTSIFLRPWHETDAADLHSIVGSTPDLNTQIGKAALEDVAAARDFIKSNLKWQPDAAYNFAIDLGGRAVGNIGLSNIDNRHRTAWTSYWVSSHVRGQKLATRGAASVANWAINEVSLSGLNSDTARTIRHPARRQRGPASFRKESSAQNSNMATEDST